MIVEIICYRQMGLKSTDEWVAVESALNTPAAFEIEARRRPE